MEVSLLLIRVILFGVFAVSGIGKLLDLDGSRRAMREFGFPESLSDVAGSVLPVLEICIALSLLFIGSFWYGSLAAGGLLLIFTVGMLRQISKGRAPDCHCFGQLNSEPAGVKSVVRNGAFLLLAGILVLAGQHNRGLALGSDFESTLQGALLLCLAALAIVGIFYLKKVFEHQEQVLRQIEILDVIAREGVQQERSDAGNPVDGLPIGSPFPDFSLPEMDGSAFSLERLRSQGRPAILVFVSPTCEPCSALLPKIELWRGELGGSIEVVLVSSGSRSDNEKKFGELFAGKVLLQEARELAELVRAKWTPTALLVGADGRIASRIAAGDAAIEALVDSVRRKGGKNFVFANGHTHNGEPKIGEPVPHFSLESINGFPVTDDFLRGRKTLVVFWSPSCPHCKAMIEDLSSWDAARGKDDPSLLVISDGSKQEHSDIAIESPVVLDPGYKTAEKLGMFGTPSAILIDEDGRIASETAVGAPNVWALVGKQVQFHRR